MASWRSAGTDRGDAHRAGTDRVGAHQGGTDRGGTHQGGTDRGGTHQGGAERVGSGLADHGTEAPGHLGRWPIIGVLAALTLHVAWMLVKPGGQFAVIAFSDLSAIAVSTLAGVGCLATARRAQGRRWRRGWLLLSAGMLSWAAGEAVWSWYELVLRRELTYPSAADVGYLTMAVLSIAGVTVLVSFRQGALRILIDGLTISASVLFVSWATVLDPAFGAHAQPLPAYVIGLAYPAGDVAMVTMTTLLLMHGGRGRRPTLGMLGLGMLAFAVADSTFAYLSLSSSYESGEWIDSAWAAGFLLIWLASQCARTCDRATAPVRPESVWPLISYIPLGAATLTSAVVYSISGRLSPVLYILSFTIVVLVVVRQAVTLRDNIELNRRLSGAVAELRHREGRLSHLAFHDPLTGLANRALFHDRTEHACAAAVRDGRSVAVLFIDLDDFKLVNDRYGHAAGDALLVEVARRLCECLRPEDTLGRLGGDEFAVLVEHVARPADLDELTERIVRTLRRPVVVDGLPLPLSASVGGALHEPGWKVAVASDGSGRRDRVVRRPDAPTGAEAVSELLRRADLAMYAAKAHGKGRSVTFEHPVSAL